MYMSGLRLYLSPFCFALSSESNHSSKWCFNTLWCLPILIEENVLEFTRLYIVIVHTRRYAAASGIVNKGLSMNYPPVYWCG